MSTTVRMAFEPKGVVVPVSQVLPMRSLHAETRSSPQYLRLAASIREVGVIEPLIVHPQGKAGRDTATYSLLDGHVRLDILKSQGATEVCCLVANDDEAFTYNHKVNQVPPIQEHFMIMKALDQGVSEERLAATLNVDAGAIRQKRDLLNGICPEAVELLKDRAVCAAAIRELKRVGAMRQIEMAELMVGANNFTVSYAKCLIVATPPKDLVPAERPREPAGMKPEDVARIQREMETLSRDFRLIEDSHGRTTLSLVLAVAFLRKLLANANVVKYLSQRHADVLGEFQRLVEAPELRNGA